MLKTIITLLQVIAGMLLSSMMFYLFMDNKVLNKATAFCDKEVVIGKSSADLIDKAKKAGVRPYFSAANLLRLMFTGSAKSYICYVTLAKGVVTANHLGMFA